MTSPFTETVDLSRIGEGVHLVPVGDDFGALIGKIVLQWGQFDHFFNDFIAAMNDAAGSPLPEKWISQNFRKRRNHYRRLVNVVFDRCPTVTRYFLSVKEKSVRYQIARNALCHGRISYETGSRTAIRAEIRAHGRMTSILFDLEKLTDTYYNMGQLAGIFNSLSMGAKPPIRRASSTEIQTLLAFLETHYWKQPKSPNGEPQPAPSRE